MANEPLESIKFPGIANTFTVPAVDNTLAVQGAPADAKKVGDEISDLKADLSDMSIALSDLFNHIIGVFDDQNGNTYIENALSALAALRFIVVLLAKSANTISSGAGLYTDDGTTSQSSLKTSNASYYYLDGDTVSEDTTYEVKITINPLINTYQYTMVYAYKGELIVGENTSTPTIYNIAGMNNGVSLVNATANPLTENYVYTQQITVKSGRKLAVLLYRDYSNCISSVTARKVVA